MSITPERLESVAFSDPYIDASLSIMVAADNNDINNADDLAGKTVAAQIGTTGADEVTALQEAGTIAEGKILDNYNTCLQELINGGCDAVIIDLPVGEEYVDQRPDDVKLVGEPYQAVFYGIAVDPENTELLDKINAGEISFEDAAKEYSEDSSADNGGDVGWDKLTTFVSDYQDALSALDVDQVSGIVESSYGFHIIKCTGHFYVDGSVTSIDQIPEDLRNQFSDTIKTEEEGTAYNDWLNNYVDEADIQINEMPTDVPYNVSLEGVTPTSETEEGASGDETTQDEATD